MVVPALVVPALQVLELLGVLASVVVGRNRDPVRRVKERRGAAGDSIKKVGSPFGK